MSGQVADGGSKISITQNNPVIGEGLTFTFYVKLKSSIDEAVDVDVDSEEWSQIFSSGTVS